MLERQRLAAEERQRQLEEKERREELQRQAKSWKRSCELRNYLRVCESGFSERGLTLSLDRPESIWLSWGREQADRLDPIINGSMENLIQQVSSSRSGNEGG